jgi:hypothetical protein
MAAYRSMPVEMPYGGLRCRTSALGGHIDVCHGCGFKTGIPYNSCRSRCYPKFQVHARQRWIEATAAGPTPDHLL